MALPIHDAAREGDLQELNRLLEEDGGRLNAQDRDGVTLLMCAVYYGQDAVVARLLALGADLWLADAGGDTAAHWACIEDKASALALLIAAGVPLNAQNVYGQMPLITGAWRGATDCVKLLLAHRGAALELDTRDQDGCTALHWSAHNGRFEVVQLLLQAGADPTVRDNAGDTPLDVARGWNIQVLIPLLEATVAEPQRPRTLLKARALLDALILHRTITRALTAKTLPPELQRHILALAAPFPYMIGRAEREEPLPSVSVQGQDAELVACVDYALHGMKREVFVELCEMMVPKWARGEM